MEMIVTRSELRGAWKAHHPARAHPVPACSGLVCCGDHGHCHHPGPEVRRAYPPDRLACRLFDQGRRWPPLHSFQVHRLGHGCRTRLRSRPFGGQWIFRLSKSESQHRGMATTPAAEKGTRPGNSLDTVMSRVATACSVSQHPEGVPKVGVSGVAVRGRANWGDSGRRSRFPAGRPPWGDWSRLPGRAVVARRRRSRPPPAPARS